MFLNAPLLPPPGQWLYSQLYPPDWPWIHLRNSSLLSVNNASSPREFKSENLRIQSDVINSDNEKQNNNNEDDDRRLKDEGINLTVARVRKAAVTLVRQKTDGGASDKYTSSTNSRTSRHSDVWRPY